MVTARILAVDNELVWRENFAAWITEDIATQDSAASTEEAIRKLRRYYYDLVLLDLAMDVANEKHRDNRPIQEYLASKPDGTRYIVVSATEDIKDAVDAAFHLGAAGFISKANVDPTDVAAKVVALIAESGNSRGQSLITARGKLIRDAAHESQILMALQPHGGSQSMYSILDTFFRPLVPIAEHQDRPYFALANGCVVALVWSRRKGIAVSAVLHKKTISEQEALASLAAWMGFSSRGQSILDTDIHRVCIRAFEEPSIGDEHFDLPAIKLVP